MYLCVGALSAGLTGLVEAPLGACLVQPGAVGILGGAPEADHAVVVGLSALAHVLDVGQLGQALHGCACSGVGHQSADRSDVAVRSSAGRVIGLHG